MVVPFNINIPQRSIEELKRKIHLTRFPDEVDASGWTLGASLDYMKRLSMYWENGFDWRKVELEVNGYPNFIAHIDGAEIHYLHIKSQRKSSVPLIITHGWPGSFLEMMKLIPFLTNDDHTSFDLVIPSIIGFGFSKTIKRKGCNVWYIAGLWNKLMLSLGYTRYVAQGGDFGAGISTALALKYPENLMGIHLNYIPGSYLPYVESSDLLTGEETEHIKSVDKWYNAEGAYAHQHRTRPLTLAYGLNDSPVGLCAWIVEKFYYWSDCNGNLETIFTNDEILSNVSLYWFTGSIYSSIQLYYENSKAPLHFRKDDFIKVPVGISHFKKESPFPPRAFIERGYHVQFWSEHENGGHFAAMEQPELLAKDLIAFATFCT